LRVKLYVFNRRDSSCIIEQHRDAVLFGDRCSARSSVSKVAGVDHRGVLLIEFAISSAVSASTSLAPVSRMALSNAPSAADPDDFVFQSSGVGSCQIYFASLPAMQAAVAEAIAPAAPDVTIPAFSASNSASRRLAACCSSNMLTKYSEILLCHGQLQEIQRAAQVRPGAAAVDHRLTPRREVNVLPRIFAKHRCGAGQWRFFAAIWPSSGAAAAMRRKFDDRNQEEMHSRTS